MLEETNRYKEGYNDCNREWENKICVAINKIKNMKVAGETFTTAINYAVLELQNLLKKG